MRAAVEADLGVSARRVVKKATELGWNTIAVVSSSSGEGAGGTAGQVETVLSVRGRRAGGGRFVVLFVDGAFEAAWVWTTKHSAVVKGYRREDRWVKQKYAGRVWYPGTRVEVLEPHLVRDESLDELVEWTTEKPALRKLETLSELLGVGGKNPRPSLLDSEATQE